MDLKAWRLSQKLTLTQLGAKIGVESGSVYRYEQGDIMPKPLTVAAIERVTGGLVTAGDLTAYYLKHQATEA